MMNKNKVEGRGWRGEELCRYGEALKNFSFCPYIIFSSDHLENSRRQQRQMQFFICNR
jgi:hypothetical protein